MWPVLSASSTGGAGLNDKDPHQALVAPARRHAQGGAASAVGLVDGLAIVDGGSSLD